MAASLVAMSLVAMVRGTTHNPCMLAVRWTAAPFVAIPAQVP